MYEEARHEQLIEAEWNEVRAYSAIDQIVRDTHAQCHSQRLWPIHPLGADSVRKQQVERLLDWGKPTRFECLAHL